MPACLPTSTHLFSPLHKHPHHSIERASKMANVDMPENETYLQDVVNEQPPPLENGMCTSAVLDASSVAVVCGTFQRELTPSAAPVKVKKMRKKKKVQPEPEPEPEPEVLISPDAQLRSEMDYQGAYAQPVYEEQHTATFENEYRQGYDDQIPSDGSQWADSIQQAVNAALKSKKRALAEFNDDRLTLTTQLQEVAHTNQVLEDQVQSLQTEKHGLVELVEQHKAKFTSLDQKANKFKTYLQGLGADMDGLMKEATSRRESSEQLAAELDERKSAQHALMVSLSLNLSSLRRQAQRQAC